MITGLFCRHFKIYKNNNFIPVSKDYENPFSLFIGNNAVGKSSVLEAIDTFFNGSPWNLTKQQKGTESFIAPVFLINKNDLDIHLSHPEKEDIRKVSEFFWEFNDDKSNFSGDAFTKFIEHKKDLSQIYPKENYYLLLVGIKKDDHSSSFFMTFDSMIKELKLSESFNLLNIIRKHYTYIYLPVETDTKDILSIQNNKMQAIMSEDILNKIEEILKEKSYKNDGKNSRHNKSIIELLNEDLKEFMGKINSTINEIDTSYEYKAGYQKKQNLTSVDIRDKVIEAYFSVRKLNKDGKDIDELSSGEQRIALIDVINSFLLHKENNASNKVIIAIDEPENSLHISKLYEQFERLITLSKRNQIIVTSHWYGALPFINVGDVLHLGNEKEKTVRIDSYTSNQYFQNRDALPDDIHLKSHFDLASSIIYSMRNDVNWILCEGSTDKRYLEHYLGEIENLRILPMGGVNPVIKLFDYIYLPLSEKSRNLGERRGKVLCLIDTDDEVNTIESKKSTSTRKDLSIFRLDSREGKPSLVDINQVNRTKTEIEDVLNPRKYFECVKSYFETIDEDIAGKLVFNEERNKREDSKVNDELESILDKTHLTPEDIRYIYKQVTTREAKNYVVKKYTSESSTDKVKPTVFEEISKYFN